MKYTDSDSEKITVGGYANCVSYEGQIGEYASLPCVNFAAGRFVIIQLRSNEILHLCEVEVYGVQGIVIT